jgi:hypothetical protein
VLHRIVLRRRRNKKKKYTTSTREIAIARPRFRGQKDPAESNVLNDQQEIYTLTGPSFFKNGVT